MSGVTDRTLGEILYLEAQLFDLEASLPLRVIADILDADGALTASIELTHTTKGVFVNSVYPMPDEETIFVKYYVYELDGITLHGDYGVTGEKFVLIEGLIVVGDPLVGVITPDTELTGIVEEPELIGITYSDVTSGLLYDDIILEGVAYEC